ncbi:MAG: carbohydrate ABC transporter permease [Anaerolineae bacterium]
MLIGAGAIALFPFLWMILASFKSFAEIMRSRALLPETWTLDAYREVFLRVAFLDALINSCVCAVSTTVFNVVTSLGAGYIFAKYRFPGKELLFMLVLSTMMVPWAVTLVPVYVTVANYGLINTLAGIVIPSIWSTFGIFMMRQFMQSIPNELIDAARIDGASEWRILFTVVGPMSAAALGALTIFAFLGSWDNFMWPLVILRSPEKLTLPLVLASLTIIRGTAYHVHCAASLMTVLPVMTLYGFMSRHFIRGLSMTGLKG